MNNWWLSWRAFFSMSGERVKLFKKNNNYFTVLRPPRFLLLLDLMSLMTFRQSWRQSDQIVYKICDFFILFFCTCGWFFFKLDFENTCLIYCYFRLFCRMKSKSSDNTLKKTELGCSHKAWYYTQQGLM